MRCRELTIFARLTANPSTAKQSVVLTGLGNADFENCVRAVVELHSRFASHLPGDTLQPLTRIVDDDHLCLEFSNRFFTPEHLATPYESVPFSDLVDPFGLLAAKAEGLHHTEDNEVLYFERVALPNNEG